MKPKQTFHHGAAIKPVQKKPGSSFGTSLGALLGPSLGRSPESSPGLESGTSPSSPADDAIRNARVRVAREVAGRGGKGVSVITGLPLDEGALEALATRLKKTCGAGGATKDGRIEIQGDHRDRLVAELVKLGYDAKRSGG
jgi:translation initiation factor 1